MSKVKRWSLILLGITGSILVTIVLSSCQDPATPTAPLLDEQRSAGGATPNQPPILSPVEGSFEVVSSENSCSNQKWCFNQHGTCGHMAGGGVGQADDALAWDINLNHPVWDSDAGQPVYAVAPGRVAATYGSRINAGGSYGQVALEHVYQGTTWWSGYLHLKNIQVMPGQVVTENTLIGYVSDTSPDRIRNHLHFAVYTGFNTLGGLKSFNAKIAPRTARTASPPTLVSPPNGSTLGSATRLVVLQWQGVPGAGGFELEVYVAGCGGQLVNVASVLPNVTTWALSGLSDGSSYFWRMRSGTSNGFSAWSGCSAFEVEQAITKQPVSASPTENRPLWTGNFKDDTPQMLLARAIFGEARGESYAGKIAVGWVIRNRVANPRWWGGATYYEVVAQPAQFSSFNQNDPNRALVENPLSRSIPADTQAWHES